MQPCTVTLTQAHTRITWTIRPVTFLPLADRQAAQLPAYAYDYRHQATN